MSNQNNASAWAKEHFDAWVRRFGTPDDYAEKIKKEPKSILGPLSSCFVNVEQKKSLILWAPMAIKQWRFHCWVQR